MSHPTTLSDRMTQQVGVRGFEPPTSRTLSERANRAALHPEKEFFESLLTKSLFLDFFRYLSNLRASVFESNSLMKINFHGIFDLVYLLSPLLCAANRS